MKKLKSKKNIFIIILLLVISSTVAYLYSTDTFQNIFVAASYKVVVTETFESPDNWKPGDTTPKTVTLKNEGTVPIKVRVKLEEEWKDSNGEDLPLASNGENVAVINFSNEEDYIYRDGYYYYDLPLQPGETTSSIIESVTFNPNYSGTITCVENNDNTHTCSSSDSGYEGGTYKLTITIEGVQEDYYVQAWNLSGIVERPYLYNVLKNETESNGLAKKYTGQHHDSFTEEPSKDIYHWYANTNTEGTEVLNKNNVVFGNHCWQMIRTTDTGGVKMIYNGEVENNKCLNSRGTHIGYSLLTTQNLNNNYWYGTNYEYDSSTNRFSLTGIKEQVTWGTTTSSSLIGKYTCRSTNQIGTCSTLYLVESYNSATSANVIPIKNDSPYYQFGSIQFNKSLNSPAYVGYMIKDIYVANTTNDTSEEYVSNSIQLINITTIDPSSYWYGTNLTYSSGKYTINNSVNLADNTANGVGKTILLCTENCSQGSTISSSTAYYIFDKIDDNQYYTKKLESGKTLSSYNMYIADSATSSTNGYTLSGNITLISLDDWYSNYQNYLNKFICSDTTKSTCDTVRYIYSNDNQKYTYISYYGEVNNNILIAKSRQGTTLIDTLLVNKNTWQQNYNSYSDYKYTCNDANNVCSEATLRYIVSYTSTGYTYVPNRYYASSITWDGTNYTLQNTINVEKYNDLNELSTHHYTCLEYGQKTCSKVAFIHYYSTSTVYYIIIKNGVLTISDVMSNMFEKNESNSIIKSGIDAWYKNFLFSFDDYIEDTVYCNERSIRKYGGWDPNGGKTDVILHFRESPVTSNLRCTKTTDMFSINNPSAQLTYKVALATAPELTLLKNNNIIKTGTYYWLITPRLFTAADSRNARVIEDGTINYTPTHVAQGLRPVISLKPGIEYTDGDGSQEHPYIVKMD